MFTMFQRPAVRWALAALSVLFLSACASSGVTGIDAAEHDEIASIHVSEVNVTLETPKPNPLLVSMLKEKLEEAMPRCATGTVDHRMNVVITDFDDSDAGKAIFMGDEIELQGRVSLVNAESDEQTGEYFVENSFFWGGFIGAAMMSDAERRLSEDFAETVCSDLFGVTLNPAGDGG